MNISQPFETFERTAFRLEALPQYIVDGEYGDFLRFKMTGELPISSGSEWADIVKLCVESGKSIKRLRLVSDVLTVYEQYELQSYPGIQFGEEIRVNARSLYESKYLYDFWFFDDEYIALINYKDDGTFISLETRKASDKEKNNLQSWLKVFKESTLLS